MDELQRYLVEEAVEDYEGGRLSRRGALKAIAGLTGGAVAVQMLEARSQGVSGAALLAAAGHAPIVAPNDPAIVAGVSEFPGPEVRLSGYLARPVQAGRHPIVLVCHENRGLTRHIEDVTRRAAKAGYLALAVDLLSREGGTDKLANDAIPGITMPSRGFSVRRRRPGTSTISGAGSVMRRHSLRLRATGSA